MAIGSEPEVGTEFSQVKDFPTFDAVLEWYRKWREEVGPDLVGGYAVLCYPRRDWITEFPEGPYVSHGGTPVHREES